MAGKLKTTWGYQGDNMNLPVGDVEGSVPFYETKLGFSVESRGEEPTKFAVLERDGIKIRLAENGGDPTQDGCAFQVENLAELYDEFKANELTHRDQGADGSAGSVSKELNTEKHDDGSEWRVFFVVAPDGLCYWFGEKQ